MLRKSHFVFASCLVAFIMGLVFLPGCATTPTPKTAESAAAPPDTPQTTTSDASVVVPTETIMGNAAPATDGQQSTETPAAEPPADIAYQIGPGDILSFRSFDDEQLSTDVTVRYDGCISLPVIPDLKVQNLTRKEAEESIKKAYSEFYVDPQVTLTIVETKSKTFTVLGEVTRPSQYPYTCPISLLDAISTAGGIRVNQRGGDTYVGSQGQLVKALVIRHEGGQRNVQDFDLRGFNKSGPDPSDARVLPGDIVYVPESANLVYLLGEVARPSVFALSDGLTLTRLLAFGGGFNESTARLKQVVVIRQINDTESKVMTVDVRQNMKEGKDLPLQPGDIIYVPRKRLVNAAEFVRQLTAPAMAAMDFQQQVLSLYMAAYNAYYTKDRYDQLFDNDSTATSTLLQNALVDILNQSTTKSLATLNK